jgi:hypothetical protein
MGRIAARVLAGVLAVASAAPIVMALFLTLLSVAVSAQQPDPTVPDGDPCCGHPDTWGEVALGFVSAAMFLLGAGAVAYLAVQLGRYAASGRAATNRQWRHAATAVAYIGIVLALMVIESESS